MSGAPRGQPPLPVPCPSWPAASPKPVFPTGKLLGGEGRAPREERGRHGSVPSPGAWGLGGIGQPPNCGQVGHWVHLQVEWAQAGWTLGACEGGFGGLAAMQQPCGPTRHHCLDMVCIPLRRPAARSSPWAWHGCWWRPLQGRYSRPLFIRRTVHWAERAMGVQIHSDIKI